MRINIAYNDSLRTVDSPSGVYFVGVTVIYNSNHFVALCSYEDSPYKQDKEIVLDENFKIARSWFLSLAINLAVTSEKSSPK